MKPWNINITMGNGRKIPSGKLTKPIVENKIEWEHSLGTWPCSIADSYVKLPKGKIKVVF